MKWLRLGNWTIKMKIIYYGLIKNIWESNRIAYCKL